MKVSGSQEIISRLDNWRKNHVSNRELVLVLAFAIGLLASLAALYSSLYYQIDRGISNLWFRCCND